MSAYQLLPPPAFIGEDNFATWENGFSDEQIKNIIDVCENYTKVEAGVSNENSINETIRKTKIAWVDYNDETAFMYNTFGYIARQLNGQFFNFDIWGFQEDFQYTVYGEEESHYTWHMDRGMSRNTGSAPRKLSLVLQLSDPDEYEGGDLQLFTQVEPITVEKKKGLVVAFPSFIMHRVTPVTKGTRRTLVVWLTGPSFR